MQYIIVAQLSYTYLNDCLKVLNKRGRLEHLPNTAGTSTCDGTALSDLINTTHTS